MASAAVPGPEDFLDYLRGLGLEDRDKTKPSFCYEANPDAAHAAGNETLTESLCLQKGKHQQEINQAKTEHMQRFKDELGQRYGFHPEITPFISFIKQLFKQLEKLDRNKSDIESSSSTWKVDRFAKYINTLKITFVQPYHRALTEDTAPHFPAYKVPDDLFSSIQQRYLELAAVYLGAQVTQALELGQDVAFLKELQSCQYPRSNHQGFR